jgi:transcriptional regulator with XRE-family HTH domain
MSLLYETFAKLCAERGLSVSAACKKAGVSPGILSDLKTGRKKTVSMDTANRLAAALGVSADVLQGLEPEENDALIAFYGEVKDFLDESDRQDLIAFMRIRAELKKNDENGNHGTGTL